MIQPWKALTAALALWSGSASAQTATVVPQTRLFVSYSISADYVSNLPYRVFVDRPRSPFFSLDSGVYGFELSIERGIRRRLGIQASVSAYADPIRGSASYCQPSSCAVSLPWTDDTRALFVTGGPVLTMHETGHTAWFTHALVGAVYSTSIFRVSGTDIEYRPAPVHQLPDTFILVDSSGFGQATTLSESDEFRDIAPAVTLGGGFDTRIGRRLQFRTSLDWSATFVRRPTFTSSFEPPVPSERHVQNHIRLSLGVVWRF